MSAAVNYPHIASMVFNTPLYATPTLVQAVRSVLEPRLLGKTLELPETLLGSSSDENAMRSVQVVGKVAVISIHGVLVPRRGQINQACQELLSYEAIRAQINAALNNEIVNEIVLDFHTGGGAAMGCKELADFIHASKALKPITAIVNFAAYSAGYYLASACSKIVCSPTAGVGSIGVIIETYEVSKWEENIGIKYSTFFRGDHKNNGSPHEPITDQAIAAIESRLDVAYDTFVNSVAEYRSMDVSAVTATQARLYDSDEALAAGLIDEIAPAQDAVNAIAMRNQAETPKTNRRVMAQARAFDTNCRI